MKFYRHWFVPMAVVFLSMACGGGGPSGSASGGGGGEKSAGGVLSVPEKVRLAQTTPQKIAANFYFVRIIEENTDDLRTSIQHDVVPPRTPFFFQENQVFFEKNIFNKLKNGEKDEHYFLQTFPVVIDPSRAVFFVEHLLTFRGVARELAYRKFYIFQDFPATLVLTSFDKTKTSLSLGLTQPLSKIEEIRYAPQMIRFTAGETDHTLYAESQEFKTTEKKIEIVKDRLEVYSFAKSLKIEKKLFEPVAKGVNSDPKTATIISVDIGTSVFSTKIFLEKVGYFNEITVF